MQYQRGRIRVFATRGEAVSLAIPFICSACIYGLSKLQNSLLLALAIALLAAISGVSLVVHFVIGHLNKRALRAVKHSVCTSCGYTLLQLPQAGRCPECGREYEHSQTAQSWRPLY